jgi:flagellar motor switch protein FliG
LNGCAFSIKKDNILKTLTQEEIVEVTRQIASENVTVTWDKNQAVAIFHAIEDWCISQTQNLYDLIENTVPGIASDENIAWFVQRGI